MFLLWINENVQGHMTSSNVKYWTTENASVAQSTNVPNDVKAHLQLIARLVFAASLITLNDRPQCSIIQGLVLRQPVNHDITIGMRGERLDHARYWPIGTVNDWPGSRELTENTSRPRRLQTAATHNGVDNKSKLNQSSLTNTYCCTL